MQVSNPRLITPNPDDDLIFILNITFLGSTILLYSIYLLCLLKNTKLGNLGKIKLTLF